VTVTFEVTVTWIDKENMTTPFVIILMGSESDIPHVEQIIAGLKEFGIPAIQRIASAHKTPATLLEILRTYEAKPQPKVYITVAGRSNALSGMVDAAVSAPVIACPPPSSSFGGADIYSSLRMPSGVAPLLILEPVNAALAAAKILGLSSSEIADKIRSHQEAHRQRLFKADQNIRGQ
jgi:5-(carboxyamino)imidazole ribonucleotide mutase